MNNILAWGKCGLSPFYAWGKTGLNPESDEGGDVIRLKKLWSVPGFSGKDWFEPGI